MLDVLLELGGELRAGREPVAQDDHRPHDGAALLVGRGDDRRLGHRLVRDERRLDLERADPVAGRDDHVVGAPDEVQVAVLVPLDAVAGVPRRRRVPGSPSEVADEEGGVGARVREHELAVVDRRARRRGAACPSTPVARGPPTGIAVS